MPALQVVPLDGEEEVNRHYTVSELDDLRRVVEDRLLFGTSYNDGRGRVSRQYSKHELEKQVEEQVRTHMIAGHTAQDILDADTPKGD